MIEAGAGFGKTTAMWQAIGHAATLGDDREVVVEIPRAGELTDAEAIGAVGAALGVAATLDAIRNEIVVTSPADVVIWVEDAHRIGVASAWLDELLAALPANGHLALVGRSMPRLAAARLEVEGQVWRVGEDQLRFDLTERRAFASLRKAEPSDASDGWAALMELEVSAGRFSPLDYLVDEVVESIPAERREILQCAALAEVIDDHLVGALSGSDLTVVELVEGLPLVQMFEDGSSDRTAVVLHDLVRDALVADLDEDTRSDAERVVASGLLAAGDHLGAARRFARLGDRDGVEAVAEALIADLHFDTPVDLRREAVDVVREALEDGALANTLGGVTEAITDPPLAVETLRRAADAARREARPDLLAVAATRLAEIGYSSGVVSEAERYRDEVAGLAAAGEPLAQRLSFVTEIYVLRMTGRTAEIPDLVDGWLADGTIADDEMRAVALFYRTVSLGYGGRVREALSEMERLSPLLPPGLFANRLGGVIATLRWQLGELSATDRASVSRLVERIGSSGQAQLFVEGAAATAMFHASAGELDAARRLLSEAEAALPSIGDRAWSTHTVAQARATMAVIDGDEALAADLLEAAIPATGPIHGLPSHVYFYAATLAYLFVPRTRPAWDALPAAPDLNCRLDVAQALVAFREGGDVAAAAALPWEQPGRIRPFAPGPLFVELAIAAASGGSTHAADALRDAQPDAMRVLEHLERSEVGAVAATASDAIRATPRRPAQRLEIGVLGPLSVCRSGVEEVSDPRWRRKRQRDLLGVLIRDRETTRAAVTEELWGGLEAARRANNLRVTLSYLLGALEPDRSDNRPSWFVRIAGEDMVLVDSDELVVDVDRFSDHVARAEALEPNAPMAALAEYRSACGLYRGDYLAGTDDAVQAEGYYEALRLRGMFVSSAVRAAELLLALDEPAEAERLAASALAVEPLTEPALRTLARALLAQGRITAATDVVQGLLVQLADLHLGPEPETARLASQLRLR